MEAVEHKVIRTIKEYHMLAPGDRVIAAVSGGADSVCLLALLWGMKKEWKLELEAVHIHHGLREQEADRDADFVRELCAGMGVGCHIIRVDVGQFAVESGMSVEEAGRYLRYEALEQEAQALEGRKGGPVKIAVAHHSDDQAETILHNLFRGSGLSGLKGIAYVRGRIIRPLLDLPRAEIISWLREKGYSWVLDSTNASDHYTRNRIRRRLLPLIEGEVNQGAVGNILRMGRLAGQADEYLRDQGKCWIGKHVKEQQSGHQGHQLGRQWHQPQYPAPVLLPCTPLMEEPEIIQSYVVMELLKQLAGSARDLGWIHVQQVLGLCGRPVGKEVHLPYSLTARRGYGDIILGRNISPEEDGGMGLPEVELEVFPYKKGTHFPKNMYTKWFDCDKIEGTPVVRTRRPGDYITLADGSRKALKRFMIDEKIPRQLRDQVPVLAEGSHVMWVMGYRISEFYKIGPGTTRILQAKAGKRKEK